MPRRSALLLVSLLVLPASLGGGGCHPSKKEMAEINAKLDAIQHEQVELSQQLAAKEEVDEGQRRELARLDSAVAGISAHLAEQRQEEADRRERQAQAPPGRPDPEALYNVPVGDAWAKGSDEALVTIVMWTDYQCPYCSRVQATLGQLEEQYGRDVRFVHKHNPLGFHPRAMPAAIAAEAAGRQGKFWEMTDLLFENQKDLTDENFVRWAKKLKLDTKRFKRDLDDPALKQRIEAQQEQGMTLGARGTPAFFINGRFLSGAQPLENFRTLIDEEMGKAKGLVSKGVPRSKVYEVTIAEGRTRP